MGIGADAGTLSAWAKEHSFVTRAILGFVIYPTLSFCANAYSPVALMSEVMGAGVSSWPRFLCWNAVAIIVALGLFRLYVRLVFDEPEELLLAKIVLPVLLGYGVQAFIGPVPTSGTELDAALLQVFLFGYGGAFVSWLSHGFAMAFLPSFGADTDE